VCGIVGALVLEGSDFSVTEPYVTKMRDTMVHRGPDGGETWVAEDSRIGLGHRRLSIIDLSTAADQPMSNEDDSIWIAFNGEIYNHAEIRVELEAIGGHTWKTDHSDTEMIIHAFEQWGIDCIHRFRGMFGIALWDGRKRELWLIRDRIGIKPIYYSFHDGRLVFASEIKALLEDPDQKRVVDEEAFFHYLTFLTTPAPMTLFDGIRKVPNATWMRITEDGSTEEERYWDALGNAEDLSGVRDDAIAERLLEELRTAVKYRKVADVPVGVFLSGGIDSSTNAALFSEGEGGPVKTFTIGYEGEYESCKNETRFARMMAEEVGAEYHETLLTPEDLIDFLPKMVWLQDEPIADPVCVPVYYVSKLARDNGVIVCQVGEGSDELFWGYPSWKTALKEQKRAHRWPRIAYRVVAWGARLLGKSKGDHYDRVWHAATGTPVFWGGAIAFTETQKRSLLSPRLKQKFAGRSSWEALAPIRERFERSKSSDSDLAWMSYVDLNMRLPELLLMRVDKMSMGVSLEGRVPFLDHKFVEFAMGIPERLKTKDGVLKYILKEAVRGVIPDELIDRPKQGFGVPVYEWFFGELGERTRQELDDFCGMTDFLDRDAVVQLVDEGNGPQVWYLLNFALWWKQFISVK
jgi:asparagine synthase (glutamine-hydrolysing)